MIEMTSFELRLTLAPSFIPLGVFRHFRLIITSKMNNPLPKAECFMERDCLDKIVERVFIPTYS